MRKRQKERGGKKKAVLYARVSTTEQATQGNSLDAQLVAMRRFCHDRGIDVVQTYREEGASGTDDKRPEFQRMMNDVLGRSRPSQRTR